MSIKIYIAKDFDGVSSTAADLMKENIKSVLAKKSEVVLGLATGNSPTGMYKYLADAANKGEIESSKIRSFNLDEYIGLPGDNIQQRVIHPESYCYFMIQEFFSLLKNKFIESCVPYGALIDQKEFDEELKKNPGDWKYEGSDAGKSIVIKEVTSSKYLSWIKKDIQKKYEEKIKKFGGIDIQVIGVGGKGHVAFHEAGIPFKDSRVLVVKLDDNTIKNAVIDGHFKKESDSPHYAVSMGAELVYEAKTVILVANGERKKEPVTKSLLEEPTSEIPISYGQIYSKHGGNLIYVIDKIAAGGLLKNSDKLKQKGIELINLSV